MINKHSLAGLTAVVLAAVVLVGQPNGVFSAQAKAGQEGKAEKGKRSGARRGALSFVNDAIGSVPQGWEIAETAGKGTKAKWEVAADPSAPNGPNVVSITANENGGGTFNLLIAKEPSDLKDLTMSVSVKALAGKQDQGGGPIWRVKDANNYYVTRWNPLETNLRLYYVKDGKRVQIATVEKIEADPKTWHKIDASHVGNKITVSLDGKQLIEAEDSTLPEGGRVGLWIKADGRSSFGDIAARPFRAPKPGGGKRTKDDKTAKKTD
jgi:hypothetical protein